MLADEEVKDVGVSGENGYDDNRQTSTEVHQRIAGIEEGCRRYIEKTNTFFSGA